METRGRAETEGEIFSPLFLSLKTLFLSVEIALK